MDRALSAQERAELEDMLTRVRAAKENPFEILDVPVYADDQRIQQAYFTLARAFHPDRFFGTRLEEYADALPEIQTALQQSYRQLKDRKSRQAIKKELRQHSKFKPTTDPSAMDHKRQGIRRRRNQSSEAVLGTAGRQTLPAQAHQNRKAMAERLYSEGLEAESLGEVDTAYRAFTLAHQFAPTDESYRKAFLNLDAQRQSQRLQKQAEEIEALCHQEQFEKAESLAEAWRHEHEDSTECRLWLIQLFFRYDRYDYCERLSVNVNREVLTAGQRLVLAKLWTVSGRWDVLPSVLVQEDLNHLSASEKKEWHRMQLTLAQRKRHGTEN